jgi:hypothetical protein
MQPNEFVIWLKGFTEGVHDFNITPKQWDLLKERLEEVNDNEFVESPGTFQDHTVQSYPPYWSPQSPFFTTSGTSGSIDTRSIVSQWTTTPNNITYTVTSGSSYIGAGSTYTHTYPNGTTVSYTAGGTDDNWNIKNKDLLHD